jgi:predicted RNA-binding protein associated with RNAse of E/G family
MHDTKKRIVESLGNMLNYYCDLKDHSVRVGEIVNSINECEDIILLESVEAGLNFTITLLSGEL